MLSHILCGIPYLNQLDMSEVGKDAGDVGSDDLEGEALLEERLKSLKKKRRRNQKRKT